MISDKAIKLLFDNTPVEASLVTLTAELADEKLMGRWWSEDCLLGTFAKQPIDRYWNWNEIELEVDGELLTSEKVAVVTGQGDELEVQGAMMISSMPVQSLREPGNSCLKLELLFTAPRNRQELRKDGRPFLIGVGTQMLIWAAWFSREQGCGGRFAWTPALISSSGTRENVCKNSM